MLNKVTSKHSNFPWFSYGLTDHIRLGMGMSVDGLVTKAIQEKMVLRQFKVSTTLSLQQASEYLEEQGYRKIYLYTSEQQDVRDDGYGEVTTVDDPVEISYFVDPKGESFVGFTQEKSYLEVTKHVSIYTVNEDTLNWFREKFLPYKQIVEKKDKSSVYMMIANNDGITIQKTGKVGSPFHSAFYGKKVKESYEFMCQDLVKEIPKGKITILSGPPGTGKTFLIRSLIGNLGSKCSFVIVPPSLVSKLGEPEMLPALLEHKSDKKPMVLVLEDADILVKERLKDSIDAISAALNMGDGILGDVCNIRLLITTNQPITEIDSAMKRPGRLSISCVVGSLNKEEISEAWKEISPDKEMPEELSALDSASIAEVFSYKKEYDEQD
jgi:hypothetical protein